MTILTSSRVYQLELSEEEKNILRLVLGFIDEEIMRKGNLSNDQVNFIATLHVQLRQD